MTPLHVASKKGMKDVITELLSAGADLHDANDEVLSLYFNQRMSS